MIFYWLDNNSIISQLNGDSKTGMRKPIKLTKNKDIDGEMGRKNYRNDTQMNQRILPKENFFF